MAAKQLLFDEAARQKVLRGVELLSKAVKVTLGRRADAFKNPIQSLPIRFDIRIDICSKFLPNFC